MNYEVNSGSGYSVQLLCEPIEALAVKIKCFNNKVG